MTTRRGRAAALLLLVAACGGKKKDPEPGPEPRLVEGLAAVPAGARVVVGVDVTALRTSPLVRRAVSQLLARDPELSARVDGLVTACKLDPSRDLEGFVVGLGAEPAQVVMVARGRFEEAALVACVRARMAAGGGALVDQPGDGRNVYQVEDTAGDGGRVWFTFGAPGTVVVAASPDWLREALGEGAKITSDSDLMTLVERARPGSGLWAAGRVDAAVGQGLVRVTGGQVGEPPRAMFGHLRVAGGLDAELGVVLASAADATTVQGFARTQLELLTVMAQPQGLGPLVSRIEVRAEGDTLRLGLVLTAAEVADLAEQIDRLAGPDKNAARN